MQLIIRQPSMYNQNHFGGGLLQRLNRASNKNLYGDGLISNLFKTVRKTAAGGIQKVSHSLKQ